MTGRAGANLVKKTHPIRGLLWGIMFGLGLAVVLVVTGIIPLELSQLVIVTVVGIGVGVLWGLFGPAKKPKGPAPASRVVPPEEPTVPPEEPTQATAEPEASGPDATASADESEGVEESDGGFRASPDDPDAGGVT